MPASHFRVYCKANEMIRAQLFSVLFQNALQEFRLVSLGDSNREIYVKAGFPEAGLN